MKSLSVLFLGTLMCVCLAINSAFAGPREVANKIFDRVVGIPADNNTLTQMEALVENGDKAGAAQVAMNHPKFYSLNLKNWFLPMTNEDNDQKVDLNDMTATIIGMVRDNVPFDQVLYGDHLYVANGMQNAYSPANNDHYVELQNSNSNYAQVLQRVSQSSMNGIADTAGVMTTRAYGAAYLSAGTNRAAIRNMFYNFLCLDMEQLTDISIPDFRVRQDIDRKPGGDSRTFKTSCVGCHSGMDALGGAWAYFNFENNQVVHTPGQVQGKMVQNSSVFSDGYRTTDDSWINLWTMGQNASIGWNKNTASDGRMPASGQQMGNGVRQLGQLIAGTDEFARCMTKQVFKQVCLREAEGSDDNAVIRELSDEFKANGSYNMKNLIAAVVNKCVGE